MTATAESLQRAHRDTAAVFLVAGAAAFLIACHLSWNADVVLSIVAGTATGTAVFGAFDPRGRRMGVRTERTVLLALLGVVSAVAATLLVALALHGDGWGVLAVVLLMFGANHARLAARAPAA